MEEDGKLAVPPNLTLSGDHESSTRRAHNRTPGTRRNHRPNPTELLVARHASGITEYVRDVQRVNKTRSSLTALALQCTRSPLTQPPSRSNKSPWTSSSASPIQPSRLYPNHRRPWCSRAAVFLPCSREISGPKIAQLYFDNVYRWFGLPRKIISIGTPLTSHFGKACREAGIAQNLSTAFTLNGRSIRTQESMDRTIPPSLDHGPTGRLGRWLTSPQRSIMTVRTLAGMTPNEALFGIRPNLYPRMPSHPERRKSSPP